MTTKPDQPKPRGRPLGSKDKHPRGGYPFGSGRRDWVKGGPSPNPKGRPTKIYCIPDVLREILQEPFLSVAEQYLTPLYREKFSLVPQDATVLKVIMASTAMYAALGDGWAVNFIAERTEGKVLQPIDIADKTVVIDLEHAPALPDPRDPSPELTEATVVRSEPYDAASSNS